MTASRLTAVHPLALAGAAVALAVLCTALPLQVAASLLTVILSVAVVILEPRFGFFLLPFTIPWGSEVLQPLGLGSVGMTDILVAAIAVSWAVRGFPLGESLAPIVPWIVALAAFLIGISASTWVATSLAASGLEILKWLEVLIVAVTAPQYLRTRRDICFLLSALAMAGMSEALLGIIQFAFNIGPPNFRIYHRFMRAYGSFGQPNPYAAFLNVSFISSLVLLSLRRNVWVWLSASVVGAGIVISFSRAGWASGLIGAVVIGCVLLPVSRRFAAGGLAVGLTGLFLAAYGLAPLGPVRRVFSEFGLTTVSFHHYTKADFSEVERAAHWVAGLRMFDAHPLFGVGIGNYSTVYPAYHITSFVRPLGHAHDYFINIAAEAGIVGFLLYCLVLTSGFALTIFALRKSYSVEARLAATVALGCWTVTTFHNLFDVVYVHEIQIVLALVMGAMAAAICFETQDENRVSGNALGGSSPNTARIMR